jgi:hypothetical protein
MTKFLLYQINKSQESQTVQMNSMVGDKMVQQQLNESHQQQLCDMKKHMAFQDMVQESHTKQMISMIDGNIKQESKHDTHERQLKSLQLESNQTRVVQQSHQRQLNGLNQPERSDRTSDMQIDRTRTLPPTENDFAEIKKNTKETRFVKKLEE